MTTEEIIEKVRKRELFMKDIKKEDRNEKFWIEFLNIYTSYFPMIPQDEITDKIAKVGIEIGVMNIQYIPENLRSFEICKYCVSKDGWTLKFVPEAIRHEKDDYIIKTALEQNKFVEKLLK